MYQYNTTEGGPCVMRPISDNAYEAPNKHKLTHPKCIKYIDKNGDCIPDSKFRKCKDAWCDDNKVVYDGGKQYIYSETVGPWSEDLSNKEKLSRQAQGWNNQFALPYEVGMYWNFTTSPDLAQRATGCPGKN